jgi:hypothetical protein
MMLAITAFQGRSSLRPQRIDLAVRLLRGTTAACMDVRATVEDQHSFELSCTHRFA